MDLAKTEKEKYEKIWKDPAYRKVSPGEDRVQIAMIALRAQPPETIIDFGCGTGRPAHRLAHLGYKVTAIDHTKTCLDTNQPNGYEFIEACLWDLPEIKAKWGYCTDVMEHIPEEKVLGVLHGISRSVERGVYFQIASFEDKFGQTIGEHLHLTVKDSYWWERVLRSVWKNVYISRTMNITAVCEN